MPDPARFWDKIADKYSKKPVKDMENYNKTLDCTRKHLSAGDEILVGKFVLRFVTVDNARSDLVAGAWEYGDEQLTGMTFEVRGAMARKIQEQVQEVDPPPGPQRARSRHDEFGVSSK